MVEENYNLLKTNLFSYVLCMLLLDLFQIFGPFRRLLTLADLLFVSVRGKRFICLTVCHFLVHISVVWFNSVPS